MGGMGGGLYINYCSNKIIRTSDMYLEFQLLLCYRNRRGWAHVLEVTVPLTFQSDLLRNGG